MASEMLGGRWQGWMDEIVVGMRRWRSDHPRASFDEIETALDEQIDRLRAKMLEEIALTSPAADLAALTSEARPRCPECGAGLQARGSQERTVVVQGDQALHLRRSYAVCPACGAGLFPPG
jgi:YgiT-type zinc finger domain-containing protein